MRLCSLLPVLAGSALAITAPVRGQDWKAKVSAAPPGAFKDLPSLRMRVIFGWSNVLQAAKAEAAILRKGGDYQVRVAGQTLGVARTLWPLDAQHSALLSAGLLRAKYFSQVERYRKRTVETQVRFDDKGLDRLRKVTPSPEEPKWKRVNFTPIYDVLGGILYVRSMPLRDGDTVGLVCFPGDSPYVTTAHVEGRGKIRCAGREWPAIRLSLKIQKLEVKNKQPTRAVGYEKFRDGTVWVSDDDLRLPLRAEVHVFVGFVYAELKSFERL